MKRTKLDDRILPQYTRGEEIFNMVTHIVGSAFGIAVLVLCIVFAAIHRNGYGIASGIIYGVSMILLYTMSSIYHGLPAGRKSKKVFQIMDHCTIFVLIAGTYTPVLLCSIRPIDPFWAWVIFAVVWGCTVIGIILNAIDIKKFATFSMICYLAMGWCIVFRINLLPAAVGMNGIYLLVAGGLAYTIGTIFYGLQKKHRYMHSIWHLWILLGSALHFLCIILYVI
ncbi:hemolysin III family protein [uncultured Thomasclavelia sp.]|uniref:PAQR family membrane homeostasis protein TrhA n=1 Tax=uncultured Thomasclavelia sp. TaxID=3025759 RepID=UPI0025DEB4B1|nr:hemolysin III family protein [uncultured Thomasclavelia sp.]